MNQISLSLTPRKTVLLRFVLLTAICLLALSASASTTISTDINTEGTLTVTGISNLKDKIYNSFGALMLDQAGQANTNIVLNPTGGNVGIGTTSPYSMLSVAGQTVSSYFTATTTTATSTFAGGMNVAGTSGLTVLQNGNVGMGTVSPDTRLTVSLNTSVTPGTPTSGTVAHFVQADNTASKILIDSFGNQAGIILRRANGTAASPTAVTADMTLGFIGGMSYNGSGYFSAPKAQISFLNSEVWTSSAAGAYMTFLTTPNGSVTSVERLRIDQNGNVGIGTTTPTTKLHVSNGASATTTVSIGELGLTSSKACVNMNQADGSAGSFYLVGGTIKVESNYCR